MNLTNDAWYGDTKAPHQHHLLAAWRAIETKRYLLRSTNTGLTAFVDPLGETSAALAVFSVGLASGEIGLLNQNTLYSSLGDVPAWVLSLLVFLSVIYSRLRLERG